LSRLILKIALILDAPIYQLIAKTKLGDIAFVNVHYLPVSATSATLISINEAIDGLRLTRAIALYIDKEFKKSIVRILPKDKGFGKVYKNMAKRLRKLPL
jgi:hypothetical protein